MPANDWRLERIESNERYIAKIANSALDPDTTDALFIGRNLVFPLPHHRSAPRDKHTDGSVDMADILSRPGHERHIALIHAIRGQMRNVGCLVASD